MSRCRDERPPSVWADLADDRGRQSAPAKWWFSCADTEKPSNKLLAATDLDSDTWVSEVKRIRGKKLPLTAALWSSPGFDLSLYL